MIQFNLLPDVKQEYLKARRTRQLVVTISFVVSGVALGILVLLLVTVKFVQQKSLSDADDDIATYSKQLKDIPNIDKILTVQNQLNTLTGLHDDKAVTSRSFDYLKQLTPSTVSISTLAVDYTASTLTLTGTASALDQVNVYADTLKETTFTTDATETEAPAFSAVVLSSFGRDDKGATYTLTLSFAPEIFSNANGVKLTVPNVITSPQQQLFQQKASQ